MRYHPRMAQSAGATALGFRVKSGFAVVVAVSGPRGAPVAIDRRIVQLSDPAIANTRQPYHSGAGTAQEDERVIAQLTRIIEKCAKQSVTTLLACDHLSNCVGAGVVVGSVIDPAAVANPHIRAHASEGRLFRCVLEKALENHGIRCQVIVEKTLGAAAAKALGRPAALVRKIVSALGQPLGGPWRAEEKSAATAAWMVLGGM